MHKDRYGIVKKKILGKPMIGDELKKDVVVAGAYGGKSKDMATTTILVGDSIAIDAGNILGFLGGRAYMIDHIFLTHSHFDHILDVPFLIDVFFERREYPLKVYGGKATLEALKKYIFNWHIWPDFNNIQLIKSQESAIEFIEIKSGDELCVDDVWIKPVASNHTVECLGYVVKRDDNAFYFTSDTYATDTIWDTVNSDPSIKKLITDVSFPSRLDKLAHDSKHMTPKVLKEELTKLKRDVDLYIYHLKPSFFEEVVEELKSIELPLGYKVLEDGYHLDSI
jgi:phosphoribosyl 1,2-cyclic phosphodiesterase